MKSTYSTGLYKAGQNVQTETSSAILGNHLFLLQWTSPWKDAGTTHPLLCQWPHQHGALSPRVSCRLQLLRLLHVKLQPPGRPCTQAPAPAHACSTCRTNHQSIHSLSGPTGHIQVCAGGGQSCTGARHSVLQTE